MFESARLKLTAWYLLLIMIITGLFSTAFYHASTRELQRIIKRVELGQQLELEPPALRQLPNRLRSAPTLEELQQLKQRSLFTLIMINGIILIFSGGASYFLAGRTLQPIKVMLDEQGDFISNASHELRTPIAILRAEMESSLLEKHLTDAQARSLITSNLEEVTDLQELTNRLLKLSHTSQLSKSDPPAFGSVAKVVATACQKVKPLAKQKQQQLITTPPRKGDFQVPEQAVKDALIILLENAIKYSSPHTTITITITTQLTGNQASIAVTDQGPGINAQDLPHIFKRFYRADKSRSQVTGYGLGLSIAQQLLTAVDGSIQVTSRPAQGSTFTLVVPHHPA